MPEYTPNRAEDFEYTTLRAETHTELSEALNEAANYCWEPQHYAIWSLGTGAGTNIERATHFVILRRDTDYYQARIAEVQQGVEDGDYESAEDLEWAEQFLEHAKEDGYDVG